MLPAGGAAACASPLGCRSVRARLPHDRAHTGCCPEARHLVSTPLCTDMLADEALKPGGRTTRPEAGDVPTADPPPFPPPPQPSNSRTRQRQAKIAGSKRDDLANMIVAPLRSYRTMAQEYSINLTLPHRYLRRAVSAVCFVTTTIDTLRCWQCATANLMRQGAYRCIDHRAGELVR